MTVLIHLDPSNTDEVNLSSSVPGSSRSTFGTLSPHPTSVMQQVVQKMRNSKRIVVICGAGVSTAASIPDFRSSSGLFHRSKGKNTQHTLKDLFHVKCLSASSESLLPHHHALMTELASLSLSTQPTGFHRYLKALDDEGRLLRVYTQNIDLLEAKAGLELGIPELPRSSPRKARVKPNLTPASPPISPSRPPSTTPEEDSPSFTQHASVSRPYRAIPLHGTLSSLHCPVCSTSVPLYDYLPLPTGPIPCPACEDASSIRTALAERPRKSGSLRPSVVLYGEEHPEGEKIGQVVERDLKGTGSKVAREGRVDFLLVCGTSLSILGVKRIVKEMAKSLQSRPGTEIKTVFVNDEPPKPTAAEWEDVFDVFVRGDVQDFVTKYVANLAYVIDPVTPKKRKTAPATPKSLSSAKSKKSKSAQDSSSDFTTPVKKLPSEWLPTPRLTPPKASEHRTSFEGFLTSLSEDGSEVETDNPFLDIRQHLRV
ncbi:DHS-like NAD/FAD-binding domain-containing protein [Kockovaella imperatae]|uniref:DHS-like NAD/FAD-binding domain-containing protein n=1 Tax=Kockovaella imperatae TaxID=4999 RepID=A0A1Y1UKY6_9TREE|nr:DHS-like NAD/FAD-binding domain-containing protein [Kockovaella imperatae]ORX38659.1 DHS-like NAD/FAD-binding domain-containing protein [Kockovaella imperatae]